MREIIRLERSTATTTGAILLARKTSPLTKQVRYTAAVFIAGRIDRGPMPSRHQKFELCEEVVTRSAALMGLELKDGRLTEIAGKWANDLYLELKHKMVPTKHRGGTPITFKDGATTESLALDLVSYMAVDDGNIMDVWNTTAGGRLIRVSGSQMLAGQPGVRAIDKINRRNRIGFYMGRMLTHEEADAVEEVYREKGLSECLFTTEDMVIDATMEGTMLSLINHSCEGNCNAHLQKVDTPDGTIWRVELWTLRDIEAGEELTYDYRLIGEQLTPCRCGAAKCRGFIELGEDAKVGSKRKAGDGLSRRVKRSKR